MHFPLVRKTQGIELNYVTTHKDIILACNYERQCLGKQSGKNKEPEFSVITQKVAQKVINSYSLARIPQVSYNRVI